MWDCGCSGEIGLVGLSCRLIQVGGSAALYIAFGGGVEGGCLTSADLSGIAAHLSQRCCATNAPGKG